MVQQRLGGGMLSFSLKELRNFLENNWNITKELHMQLSHSMCQCCLVLQATLEMCTWG
jgi:hypothetical protein